MIQINPQTEQHIIDLANQSGQTVDRFLESLLASYKLPNAETIAAMKEAESGNLPRFNSIQELFDDLEKNSEE